MGERNRTNETDQPLSEKQRRALATFVGFFCGALPAWILAELLVRGTPYSDVLHISIAIGGGMVGVVCARWRAPRDERLAPRA